MSVDEHKNYRLILLRHARAGWATPGGSDFDRALDAKGAMESEQIGNVFSASFTNPDLILCSTAKRCRQTLDLFQNCLDSKAEVEYLDRLYSGHLNDYIEEINNRASNGSLMIVGHNPMIEAVLAAYLGEDACRQTIPEGYPTAGLAVLEKNIPSGKFELVSMLTP